MLIQMLCKGVVVKLPKWVVKRIRQVIKLLMIRAQLHKQIKIQPALIKIKIQLLTEHPAQTKLKIQILLMIKTMIT